MYFSVVKLICLFFSLSMLCWTVDTIIPINHTSSSSQHVQSPVITLPGLLSGSGLCWTANTVHWQWQLLCIYRSTTVIITVKKCEWVSETCIFTDMLLACMGSRPVGGNVWFKSKAWQSTQLIVVHLVKTFQVKLYTVLIVNVTYTVLQCSLHVMM